MTHCCSLRPSPTPNRNKLSPASPRRRRADGRAHCLADLLDPPVVERVRQEARQERQSGSASARRSGGARLQRRKLNRLWLPDITEHRTAWVPVVVATLHEGWRCCRDRSTARNRRRSSLSCSTEMAV